jgi:hypothetical protein
MIKIQMTKTKLLWGTCLSNLPLAMDFSRHLFLTLGHSDFGFVSYLVFRILDFWSFSHPDRSIQSVSSKLGWEAYIAPNASNLKVKI